ncbi:MAG: R3H domain-containing nucleic acid-binding protein [Ornithinimicrobium sp.]
MDTTTDHVGPSDTDEETVDTAGTTAAAETTDTVGTSSHSDAGEVTSDRVEPSEASAVAQEQGEQDAEESAPSSRRSRAAADLEREGEVAADFLETLMDIADLDGDLEVDVDGDRAAVSIVDSDEGSVPRRLVGTKAVVLEALQELTRLAVQAETGDRSRLMLDIGGHRAQRRDSLVQSAADVIATVQADGERRELEPMTAFERKVVHDEVLKAGLRSESEGEEPRRFVVVMPASS